MTARALDEGQTLVAFGPLHRSNEGLDFGWL